MGQPRVLVSKKKSILVTERLVLGLRDHSTAENPMMNIGQKVEIFANLEALART
jgi:hypothetical protein